MDSRFLFKYTSKDDFRNHDFFFDYPLLIELDLSNYPFFFIPPSISQCQLIKHVNIANTNFNEPPAIFFALPQIRAHPENLVFGKNQHCTKELMMNIIGSCATYNQGFLNFKEINGRISSISYSPDTTTLDFILMIYPELKSYIHYIFLVREIKIQDKIHKLYVIPDDVPIILYQYFNSTWSIELGFMPPVITEELAPYAEKASSNNLASYYSYNANLENSSKNKQITISVSESSVSIIYNPSSYVVCDNRSVYLEYVDGNVLLFFGNRALVLNKSSIQSICPLFRYTLPHFYFVQNPTIADIDEKKESFLNLAMKSAMKSLSVKLENGYSHKVARKLSNTSNH